MQDFRYGLRRLAQSPGFTAIVILTLAVGIGANTAIFSVVDAALLKPLPYRQPERLVTIEHFYPSLNALEAPVSVPGFRDYSARRHVFASMAVESGWGVNLTGRGEPERLIGSRVTGRFFTTLGVPPAAGRTILPGDDRAGHDKIVVLSQGLAGRLFGGAHEAVGKKLLLDSESHEVVGVMPAGFRDFFSREIELWVPIVFKPEQFGDDRRTNEWLDLAARLKPGVTLEQARADMKAFAEQLKQQFPDNYPPDWTLTVTPLAEQATGDLRPALLVLLGAVGFVLLIACANVANLLLARAATRGKEVAVRAALGATRWQLVRQLLVESLTLSIVGGAVGLALAAWGVRAAVRLQGDRLPFAEDVGIDGTVLAFTLLVSVATGLLFGLVPALQTSRARAEALKEGGRTGAADRSGKAVRRGLVVVEVALALTLLASAGLLIRSFARLQGVDPGFDPDRLLTFNLALPESKYTTEAQQIAFFDQVRARLAALPGVQAVAASSVLPFSGQWATGSFEVEGVEIPPDQPGPWGDIRFVSPDFFRALGIPLLRGRTLTEQDGPRAVKVAVIDEEMARRYWPGGDPLGKRLTFGPPPGGTEPEWIEIVGVVGHTKHEGLDAENRIQLYFSYHQNGIPFLSFAVRTAGDPVQALGAVRQAVREVDPSQPISRVRTMDEMIGASFGQRRFSMLLLGLFSGIALLLAALGIYGVMSYAVTQRSHELGVRLALGAARPALLGLILRQGMVLAAAGLGLGLAAALGLTRVVQSQLFEVRATDPLTFVAVVLLLGLTAALANALPALRATRVDPVVVLREE